MKYDLKGLGMPLKKLHFELFDKGDLIFFEGPVLSHFVDSLGNNYLMRWTEMDDSLNRWMLVHVEKEVLIKYLNQKLTLLSLIKKTENGAVWFIDIDSEANYQAINFISINNIPDAYWPGEKSYFSDKFATKYALSLKTELSSKSNTRSSLDTVHSSAASALFGIKHHQAEQIFVNSYLDPLIVNHASQRYFYDVVNLPLMIVHHAFYKHNINIGTEHSELVFFSNHLEHFRENNHYDFRIATEYFANTRNSDKLKMFTIQIITLANEMANEFPKEYGSLIRKWKKALKEETREIEMFEDIVEKNLF